jgi:hypothetical protein
LFSVLLRLMENIRRVNLRLSDCSYKSKPREGSTDNVRTDETKQKEKQNG